MKFTQRLLCSATLGSALLTGFAQAASWQDTLSSAASELSQKSTTSQSQQGGLSLSSLTGLLNGGNQALSADTMNNAAGVMSWCAKNKLSSLTNTENVKNQVLDKLGLGAAQQKQDTNYLEGIQGMLNTKNGEQLNLSNIGSTPLAEKVKSKACDIVLKQGVNFLS
ncbi:hypothetical protein BBB57_11420 [Kosakonia sacchari]|uniref:DUF2501 domain-containing protein n=1 Tax=Kosakonia sacchari TaxID=1158459 RepID=A0A1G4Y5Z4_9ENTR|nr:DUF2501 domain-containing protein [Kosakonia sacchari]AHJ75359.1 hypothetical protein C813_11895 [Kosakonia sacchari SP1]ANR78811.1 hypothetical protein BBB57_11420 [Kosakonia sacchari]SCX48826.1 Protein of unknown function [Kosakonia sacchari]